MNDFFSRDDDTFLNVMTGAARSFQDSIFAVDREGSYVFFNQVHADWIKARYGLEIKLGMKPLQILASETHLERATEAIARALSGESVVEQIPRILKDGAHHLFEVHFFPLKNRLGAIYGVTIASREETEHLSNIPLSLAPPSQSPEDDTKREGGEAVWEIDLMTGKILLSLRFFVLLGYEDFQSTMELESWTDLIHPNDRQEVMTHLDRMIEKPDQPIHWEYRLKTSTGGWRWFRSSAHVILLTAEGRASRIAGLNHDITRRKIAELALVESEARWNSLVKETPVIISIIDRQRNLLFINKPIPGFSETDLIGRPIFSLFKVEAQDMIERSIETVFESHRSIFFQARFYNRHQEIWTENHMGPVWEDGQVKKAVTVSINVTKRLHLEHKALMESKRHQFLLELYKQSALSGTQLFGFTLKSLMELTQSELGVIFFFDEEKRTLVEAALSDNLAAQLPGDRSQPLPLDAVGSWAESARSGKLTVMNRYQPQVTPSDFLENAAEIRRFLSAPVFENGRIVAMAGVGNKAQPYGTDDENEISLFLEGMWQIHRRKQAEEELQKLRLAVENSPVAIMITDPKGSIEYVNPEYCRSSGYAIEELLGKSPNVLKSGKVADEVYKHLWRTISQGSLWHGEIINRRKNGELMWERVFISPVLDHDGRIKNYIEVKEDFTERKRTDEALIQAQKMESVGQLAAGVAHDFNNFLAAILAFNEMLLIKIREGDPLRIYPERIQVAGKRAVDLVSGLLAFGRRQLLAKTVIAFDEFFKIQLPLIRSLVPESVDFHFRPADESLRIEGDPNQLSQVLVNLITNARDAMNERGSIWLTLGKRELTNADCQKYDFSPPGTYAFFSVRDNGPGVAEELKSKIFEPFFTTKEVGKGTGLGLAVVFGIIKQHNGLITVESGLGQGCEFCIYLPLFWE